MPPRAKLFHRFGKQGQLELKHEGIFELLPLPGAGVIVNGFEVEIRSGVDVRLGRGPGVLNQGMSLTWHTGSEGEQWVLELLDATERDRTTIQRILMRLPPLPPPIPIISRPEDHDEDSLTEKLKLLPSRPRDLPSSSLLRHRELGASGETHRQSLLLVDDETNEIVAVVPLSTPAASTPGSSRKGSTIVADGRPAGEALAAQVDAITRGLFPGHGFNAETDAEMTKLERSSKDQMAMHGGRGYGVFAALPVPGGEVLEEDRESCVGDNHGLDILDSNMGRLDPLGPVTPPRNSKESEGVDTESRSVRQSIASVSSLATFGTDRYETASEGGDTVTHDDSARSSLDMVREASEPSSRLSVASEGASDTTPTPSRIRTREAISHYVERHPTDSNGDAILLRFLEGGADGLPSRIVTSAVTQKEIESDKLVEAVVEPDAKNSQGWLAFFGLASSQETWTSWLTSSGWWPFARDTPIETKTPSLTEQATSYFVPSFDPKSLASTPRPIARQRPRKAGGETSSRLSVWYHDETGTAKRAYLQNTGRPGFGDI